MREIRAGGGQKKLARIPNREPVRLETYWHTSAALAPQARLTAGPAS